MTISALALALSIASQPLAAVDPAPFLTLTRSATGIEPVQLEMGVLRSGPGNNYWFRRVDGEGGALRIRWADTQSCEGAQDVVLAASQLEPPGVQIPGIPVTADGSIMLTLDGVQYTFESGAHYNGNATSRIRFTANVGTPLATFAEETLATLEPCWADDAPGALYPSPE